MERAVSCSYGLTPVFDRGLTINIEISEDEKFVMHTCTSTIEIPVLDEIDEPSFLFGLNEAMSGQTYNLK